VIVWPAFFLRGSVISLPIFWLGCFEAQRVLGIYIPTLSQDHLARYVHKPIPMSNIRVITCTPNVFLKTNLGST
jgi:hypothetical protein